MTLTANANFASQGSSDALELTVNILNINAPMAGSVAGVKIRDIRLHSANALTGGFAFAANGMFNSVVDKLVLDGGFEGNYNLCGGAWFNGAVGVDVFAPEFASHQNCGDGLLVNSATLGGSTSNAELRVYGGAIGGGAEPWRAALRRSRQSQESTASASAKSRRM